MIQTLVRPTRRSTAKPAEPQKPVEASEPNYAAPALEKGLDILELLAGEADGMGQGAIAQRLGRSTAELFRMLNVLERRGYLSRHADGSYRLSLRLFELAHRHPPLKRLLTVALPVMQQLAQASRQSAHLVIHFARQILVVAQVDSPEPMGFGVRLGANFPFRPDRASSRVLSAFQPAVGAGGADRRADRQQHHAHLGQQGPRRPGDHRRQGLLHGAQRDDAGGDRPVRADLRPQRRRSRGADRALPAAYYMAPSETTLGVTDLCAPIFDHSDGAVAALTVPYLQQRDVHVTIAAARAALLASVRQISAGLGAPVERC